VTRDLFRDLDCGGTAPTALARWPLTLAEVSLSPSPAGSAAIGELLQASRRCSTASPTVLPKTRQDLRHTVASFHTTAPAFCRDLACVSLALDVHTGLSMSNAWSVLSAIFLAGCFPPPPAPVVVLQAPPEAVRVPRPPPDPLHEAQTPRPDDDCTNPAAIDACQQNDRCGCKQYVWQDGYWDWSGTDYEWIAGGWNDPPSLGYLIISALYSLVDGFWTYRQPFWSPPPDPTADGAAAGRGARTPGVPGQVRVYAPAVPTHVVARSRVVLPVWARDASGQGHARRPYYVQARSAGWGAARFGRFAGPGWGSSRHHRASGSSRAFSHRAAGSARSSYRASTGSSRTYRASSSSRSRSSGSSRSSSSRSSSSRSSSSSRRR
jgi:hypothetical protein